jgi:uncharacterized integral membrane protein
MVYWIGRFFQSSQKSFLNIKGEKMSEEKENPFPDSLESKSPETPVMDSSSTEKKKKALADKPKQSVKGILTKVSAAAVLVLIVIFTFQNAVLVNIRFLAWDSRVFLSMALLFSFAIGLLSGWLIWKIFR